MAKNRVILHIDMNAFYCSVHEAAEPEKYKGKSIAVAGSEELRKGVIVTSSYSARAKGIKTGMLVSQGRKLDPNLIIIPPNFDLYRHYSREFMKIAYQFSPILEAASIDECYLDVSGSSQFGHPIEIAKKIQQMIKEQLGLPSSIGIGPNKLLAKMGSDMKKPNGITILRKREFPKLFWAKPTNTLFGIGKRLAERLEKLGIKTIGELAGTDDALLKKEFGVLGSHLKDSANGIDHTAVVVETEANKSVGHTTTLPKDIQHKQEAYSVFLGLADQVTRRMRKQQLLAATIQITIRYSDRKTITRSITLDQSTEEMKQVYKTACQLFDQFWNHQPVRLLGITLQNLRSKEDTGIQLDMFNYQEQPKKESLNKIMDQLRDKYGENTIITAGMKGIESGEKLRNTKARGTSLQKDYLKHNPIQNKDM